MRMRRKTEEDEAEIMMSPMIDAVFLLLIFFLVAMMYKKEKRDINITPPASISDTKLKPEDETLVIGIDQVGEFYWQGRPTTTNEMHMELRRMALEHPDRRVRLDADANTPYWRVVEVLDALNFRGLRNVGIRTYDDRYNRR